MFCLGDIFGGKCEELSDVDCGFWDGESLFKLDANVLGLGG